MSATTQYSDLLLECAPISIVKAMNIATDTGWDTRYDFGTAYGDYFTGCSKNVMYVDDFEWVY